MRSIKKWTRKQKGGTQTLIDGFQAADAFIVHELNKIDHVILFESTLSKGALPSLGLPGGRCDTAHKGSLEMTIESELFEESRMSIKIQENVFKDMTKQGKYVDTEGDSKGLKGPRRCFLTKVPFISVDYYKMNKDKMDELIRKTPSLANGSLYSFVETRAMVRIPLSLIQKAFNDAGRKKVAVNITHDGKDYHIQGHVLVAYSALIDKGLLSAPYDMAARITTRKSEKKCTHWASANSVGGQTDFYV